MVLQWPVESVDLNLRGITTTPVYSAPNSYFDGTLPSFINVSKLNFLLGKDIMKYIIFLAISLLMTNIAYADTEMKTYPKESCQEIYKAIGTFVHLADGEWKKGDGKMAMFYSTASANYATIYQTVCKK